jgi:hypothetical protein
MWIYIYLNRISVKKKKIILFRISVFSFSSLHKDYRSDYVLLWLTSGVLLQPCVFNTTFLLTVTYLLLLSFTRHALFTSLLHTSSIEKVLLYIPLVTSLLSLIHFHFWRKTFPLSDYPDLCHILVLGAHKISGLYITILICWHTFYVWFFYLYMSFFFFLPDFMGAGPLSLSLKHSSV